MVKRNQRPAPAKPARKQETKPTWSFERHSGEGSASALEILQKLEKRRVARTQMESPRPDEDDPPA